MAELVVDGVALHVQRLGPEAPADRTVVFLHGLVMDNLSSWYFTAATSVASTADVILYDLRGHGRSARPATGYDLARHVADLYGLLAALGVVRPVDLVGNSFGGLLALAFARAHPAQVRSILLVDGHLGDEGFGEQMAATLSLEGEERDRRIASSFESWLGRHSERKRNRLAEAATELVSRTTLVADLRGTPPLGPAEMAEVRCPILALYGERSDLRERGERLLASARRCTLVVLPGCTHSVLWEATDEVRRRIEGWVAQEQVGGA